MGLELGRRFFKIVRMCVSCVFRSVKYYLSKVLSLEWERKIKSGKLEVGRVLEWSWKKGVSKRNNF